jgi:hypothetical protein
MAATGQEAFQLKLPENCVQLLGYVARPGVELKFCSKLQRTRQPGRPTVGVKKCTLIVGHRPFQQHRPT